MMSHNKHHGGLRVVLGERYKTTHNFIKKELNMSGTILYRLSMSSFTNLNIHMLCILFSFMEKGLLLSEPALKLCITWGLL